MKLSNDYARATGEFYWSTPKAVWAALAVSFALRLNEGDLTKAVAELSEEWSILHRNGIVPQKPESD